MRNVLVALVVMGWCLVLASCATAQAEKPAAGKGEAPAGKLANDKEKLSYTLGLEVGESIKRAEKDVDLATFIRGIDDAYGGKEPLLSAEEAKTVRMAYYQKMQGEMEKRMQEEGQKNATEGKAFLEANGKKEGVVTTPSGLQYIVVKKGEGAKPKLTDTVTVNYRGTLLDGREFDSSFKRGQPATFPVQGIIRGWQEPLQLMGVGSTYKVFVPADLAYGPRGRPPVIGPNATLIFEISLLEIKAEADAKAPEDPAPKK